MDHARTNLRMAEQEREDCDLIIADQQVLIKELRERSAELEAALIYALAPDGVHTDMPGGVMIRQRFAAQEWDLVRRELPANGVEYTLKRKE